MKKRIFIMSLSLFVMAPAVFGATQIELGMTRYNSDFADGSRDCTAPRDESRRVTIGNSAGEAVIDGLHVTINGGTASER